MKDNNFSRVISLAKKEKKVIAIALYGSSLNGQGRDIDICLFLDRKYSNLEMSQIRLKFLKVLSNKYDIQVFQQLPLYLRPRILKESRILLSKNQQLLYSIAYATIREYSFFEKHYNEYLRAVQNGH